LHVRVARVLPACLPAHLLMMAIRLHDRERNDMALMQVFQCAHNAIHMKIQASFFLNLA
jgi:hypothetical protein